MSNDENVTSRMSNGIQVISISGQMTYDFVPKIKDQIQTLIIDANGYIVDLTKVEKIDSVGLGLLVNTAKKIISNQNKVVIVNTDKFTQELFEISKLDAIFEITESIAEAEKLLKEKDEIYWSKISKY